jgi:hypothetical protein
MLVRPVVVVVTTILSLYVAPVVYAAATYDASVSSALSINAFLDDGEVIISKPAEMSVNAAAAVVAETTGMTGAASATASCAAVAPAGELDVGDEIQLSGTATGGASFPDSAGSQCITEGSYTMTNTHATAAFSVVFDISLSHDATLGSAGGDDAQANIAAVLANPENSGAFFSVLDTANSAVGFPDIPAGPPTTQTVTIAVPAQQTVDLVLLTDLIAVPEPALSSSLLIGGIGLLALRTRTRPRRKTKTRRS